jgi:hypothetical protein
MRKYRWVILALFVASLVYILPPIIHLYSYPNISDDTPTYLQIIRQVAHGNIFQASNYAAGGYASYRYAAPALVGLLVKIIHTNPYWTFYVLSYLSLVAMAISVFFFCTKVFNRTAGCVSLIFMMATPPLFQFFLAGEVFNLTNLLILGLMGLLALIYFFKTKRIFYAVVSIMIFSIAGMYHSSSGLEVLFGVGLFIVLYTLYNAFRRAWREVRCSVVYGLVFLAVCGGITALLSPEARHLVVSVFTTHVSSTTESASYNNVSLGWFIQADTAWLTLLLAGLSSILVIKNRAKLSETMKLGFMALLSVICVISVCVFLTMGEPQRSAQDLGLFVAVLCSGLVGFVLYEFRGMMKPTKIKVIGLFVFAIMTVPCLRGWFAYHSSIHPADASAIAEMNTLNGTYSVSSEIQPTIYELFINKTYVPTGGDYIIYRNVPMTGGTTPHMRWTLVNGNGSVESGYAGLPLVAHFDDGKVEVNIYSGK